MWHNILEACLRTNPIPRRTLSGIRIFRFVTDKQFQILLDFAIHSVTQKGLAMEALGLPSLNSLTISCSNFQVQNVFKTSKRAQHCSSSELSSLKLRPLYYSSSELSSPKLRPSCRTHLLVFKYSNFSYFWLMGFTYFLWVFCFCQCLVAKKMKERKREKKANFSVLLILFLSFFIFYFFWFLWEAIIILTVCFCDWLIAPCFGTIFGFLFLTLHRNQWSFCDWLIAPCF